MLSEFSGDGSDGHLVRGEGEDDGGGLLERRAWCVGAGAQTDVQPQGTNRYKQDLPNRASALEAD